MTQLKNQKIDPETSSTDDDLAGKIFATLTCSIFPILGLYFLITESFFIGAKIGVTIFALIIILGTSYIGLFFIYCIWFAKESKKPIPDEKQAADDDDKGVRIGMIGFGLVFVLLGLSAVYLFVIEPSIGIIGSRDWVETPCKIISAEVGDHGDTYSIDITYEYTFNGTVYRSTRYDFTGGSSSGYDDKYEVIDRYRRMDNPVCYVNPKNPSEAVIFRKLDKTALILAPMVLIMFVGIGLGIMIAMIRKIDLTKKSFAKNMFGGILVLLVGIASIPLCAGSVIQNNKSLNWTETPCTILSAGVKEHFDEDGKTYSIDITFEYIVNEKTYQSSRYDAWGGSSSGLASKQKIVTQYMQIENPVCYVNPGNPYEAVLVRGFSWKGAVLISLPLIFIVAGLITVVVEIKRRRNLVKKTTSAGQ